MSRRLLRVSKITESHGLPWKKSTCYKLNHVNKIIGLFYKIGGQLYIDLDKVDEIIEDSRVIKK